MSTPSSPRKVREGFKLFFVLLHGKDLGIYSNTFLFFLIYCIVLQIFGFKDNLFPAPADEEDSKQLLPKKPRSAFICFTDAKKKELLERDGLPQKKNEILNLGTCHSSKACVVFVH